MNASDHRELLGLGPEDLDGFTIEELSDYLEANRTPPDPRIEQSAGCQLALDALQRLKQLTPRLLEADAAAAPPIDEGWVQGVLAGLKLDARAGRRVPLASSAANADIGITEGALRAIVRGAERVVPGVFIGKCGFDGDITEIGTAVRVAVELSVPFETSIPAAAQAIRDAIHTRLATHTTLRIEGVDVTVHDIHHIPHQTENGP